MSAVGSSSESFKSRESQVQSKDIGRESLSDDTGKNLGKLIHNAARSDGTEPATTSVTTRLKENLKNISNRISNLFIYQTQGDFKSLSGKSIFSLSVALVRNREIMESIEKSDLKKHHKFLLKMGAHLGAKLIDLPIAITYEIASGVLKCIKQVPINLAKTARLGKIKLLTNLAQIDDSDKLATLKRIKAVATAAIEIFARSLATVVSSSLLATVTVLEYVTKGGVLLTMNPATAIGKYIDRGQGFALTKSTKTSKIYRNVNKLFNNLKELIALDIEGEIKKAAELKTEKIRTQAQQERSDLSIADKKRVGIDDVKKHLQTIIIKPDDKGKSMERASNIYVAEKSIMKDYLPKCIKHEAQYHDIYQNQIKLQLERFKSEPETPRVAKEKERLTSELNESQKKLEAYKQEIEDILKNPEYFTLSNDVSQYHDEQLRLNKEKNKPV